MSAPLDLAVAKRTIENRMEPDHSCAAETRECSVCVVCNRKTIAVANIATALVAEVERLAAEVERRERIIDAERNMQAKLVAEGARLSAENARLRAVRDAAQAGPFPPWISDDVNEFGERECFGCQRHGVEGEHSPRCRFGPIAAALRAAGGG